MACCIIALQCKCSRCQWFAQDAQDEGVDEGFHRGYVCNVSVTCRLMGAAYLERPSNEDTCMFFILIEIIGNGAIDHYFLVA